MNNKKRALLIAIMVLLIFAAVILYMRHVETQLPAPPAQQSETSETAENKTKVPNFTALDESGNEVELYDYLGKPVVLNFWATWCGYCVVEMPAFEEAYNTYGEEINFLMVNLTDGSTETVETASDYIAQQGYTFPILFDTGREAVYAYGVYSVPVTYFIDAEGNLVTGARGAMNKESLQSALEMLLEQ